MIIDLIAHTGSKQLRLEKRNAVYHAYIHAKPIGGCANDEIVALLSKYFNTAKSKITIVRGVKGKQKAVEILA